MALTHYAGDRITGLTADTKPTNVLEGALFFELDGDKRVFEFIDGAWEVLIGADVEVDDDYFEITNGELTLTAAFLSDIDENTTHRGLTNNPHSVTASQVGLGNVSNDLQVKDADKALQADAEAGTNDTKWMTPLKTKQAIDEFAGAAGEANTASNVGGAVGLFLEKVGVDLRFRTIEAGDNITFDFSDPNKVVINGEAGGGGGIDAITTESTGSNTTITTSNAAMHKLTMTGNLTATIADFPESSKTHRFILKVMQDGTGGRTLTIAGNVLFPAGIQPANSESAGAFDLYEFVWDGTNWLLDNKTSAYS